MLVFMDETGDHNLENIDPQYPLFGLGALMISEEEYEKLDMAVDTLKEEFFGGAENFILHSSELKRPTGKRSDPRNQIMFDPAIRSRFYDAFDKRIMLPHKMQIIVCFIRKIELSKKYYYPANPYLLSFENVLNRVLRHGGSMNHMYAENRGPELDIELLAEYERFTKVGTPFFPASTVLSRTSLEMMPKKDNSNGLQVIDLALSSLARAALGKEYKMQGNDLDPVYIRLKYPCPPTFFPPKQ